MLHQASPPHLSKTTLKRRLHLYFFSIPTPGACNRQHDIRSENKTPSLRPGSVVLMSDISFLNSNSDERDSKILSSLSAGLRIRANCTLVTSYLQWEGLKHAEAARYLLTKLTQSAYIALFKITYSVYLKTLRGSYNSCCSIYSILGTITLKAYGNK